MLNTDNYINTVLSDVYNIFNTQFGSTSTYNYVVDYKPLEDTTIPKPTILLLYPRTSQLDYEKVYNGQNQYTFYINVFCLSDNELGSSKLSGEITKFVNTNQDKFSVLGFNNAKIISAERVNNSAPSYNSTGSQGIYAYVSLLKGYVIF